MIGFCWSGWQDSNLRPPRPKRGAITGLRYTPNWLSIYRFAPLFFIFFSKTNASDLDKTSICKTNFQGKPFFVDGTIPRLCLLNLSSIFAV